jgi:folate-binding protein YgfZ
MNAPNALTSAWTDFLIQQGANIDASVSPEVRYFGATTATEQVTDNFVAPLTDIGLVQFTGEDAATFLHSQLTNDVTHLPNTSARLAGYCTAKGRLLATSMLWKLTQDIVIQLPLPLLPAITKRLQMFIMRAKAKPAVVTAEHAILGLVGDKSVALLQEWFPQMPSAPYDKIDSPAGTLIRLPHADNTPRFQWIAPVEIAIAAWPIVASVLTPAATAAWRLADVAAGVPHITLATQEQFVPQMINYELIGGVNFKKGCYPGQEIVARSQYLGKLKRRTTLAYIPSIDVAAGAEVFASTDPEQPCGMVVNAERVDANGSLALIEIKLAALTEGTVHLGNAQGVALAFRALPYELTEPQ